MLPVLVTKDYKRTTLGKGQRPVVRAIAEAFFSPDGECTDDRLDLFVEEVDRFISPASKTLRFGLLAMLFAIRWSPFLFGKFKPFEALDREARLAHLERLERSKAKELPLMVVAYKTMMTMIFYEDERELVGLGYPGPERRRYLAKANP